jgi:DNA repair exonuclease SbcCD ATPase subunit
MITLKTLKWDNCFSYGAGNSLDLDTSTLTQVLGTNGVGKSSIPVILEEVLYNKNSRGIKKADIPNRNIGKGYNIYLEFSKDEEIYEVYVERASTIKVKLLKNGEDISSHTATNTYKTLQDIIGIDFKTFSQVVYQNTNASLQFLTATDTNRKKFLIDLLNLDNYIQYFEVFKAAAKDTGDNVSRIQGQLDTVQKWLETNKLTSTEVLPEVKIPSQPENAEKELASLTAEIKNISQKNKKIQQNNGYKKLLSAIDIHSLQNSPYKEVLEYDDLQEELGQAKAKVASANATIKKMQGLGHECHTCGQEIAPSFKDSLVSKELDIVLENQDIIKSLSERIAAIQENNTKVREVKKKIEEWESLFSSIDNTLGSELLDEAVLKEKIASLEKEIADVRKQIDAAIQKNQKAAAHNTRIQVILEQARDFEAKLAEYSQHLAEEEAKLSNLEILKKAFSTNGLVAYKIENLVKELEELTNKYLAELSDGRFTLGFVVSNDKLNVEVTDNGKEVDILSLSSGELARVNTSTLLAIRRLMSSISHSKINVLFLDEVINVLDDQGKEKLVEVLLDEEDLNTYLVSHGWTHPLLDKIEVIKQGQISRLEV